MKFDFETQDFVNTLQEMLEDYGRMALTDGRKCYSLWLDYAPQLPEEGELLKVFLELDLGKQVVELKTCSAERRVEWKKQAVENMVHAGETQKDAASLVDAVLEALGWREKKAPVIMKEPVKTPVKKPDKTKTATNTKTMPQQEKKTEPRKKPDKKSDNKQAFGKKSDPVLDMASQELQARWLYIVKAYLPKVFPQIHKIDFETLQVPKYIMDVLKKHLGEGGVQQHQYLAYGKDEQKGFWIVLTDSSIIVYLLSGSKEVFVIPYQQLQRVSLVEDGVTFISSAGWITIDVGIEGCYLVAMLRLMQGAVGEQVITRDEWKTLFVCADRMEINDRHYCTTIAKLSLRKQNNLWAWMNSVHIGYTEEQIIAVIDETVFGSCKDATVITENSIYQKYWSNKYRIFYSDITHIVENADRSLSITIHQNRKITLYHVGNKSLFNKIIQMIVFVKQHSK